MSLSEKQILKTSKFAASVATFEARAKAEAALTRATYAQKEINVRVKQAQLKVEETCLEATLNALQQEREAEAAAAEASVFEAAAESGGNRTAI